ncbi:hypothetical protein ACFL6I_14395 [candidate division KSB1 bacterium]
MIKTALFLFIGMSSLFSNMLSAQNFLIKNESRNWKTYNSRLDSLLHWGTINSNGNSLLNNYGKFVRDYIALRNRQANNMHIALAFSSMSSISPENKIFTNGLNKVSLVVSSSQSKLAGLLSFNRINNKNYISSQFMIKDMEIYPDMLGLSLAFGPSYNDEFPFLQYVNSMLSVDFIALPTGISFGMFFERFWRSVDHQFSSIKTHDFFGINISFKFTPAKLFNNDKYEFYNIYSQIADQRDQYNKMNLKLLQLEQRVKKDDQ